MFVGPQKFYIFTCFTIGFTFVNCLCGYWYGVHRMKLMSNEFKEAAGS